MDGNNRHVRELSHIKGQMLYVLTYMEKTKLIAERQRTDLMRPDSGKSVGERMQRDSVSTNPPDASVKSLTDLPHCSHLQQRADRPHSSHKR